MFTIIGGNPFTGYTGTTTFTSIRVVATVDTFEEVKKCVANEYENCGGLMLVLYNGQELEYDDNGKMIDPKL